MFETILGKETMEAINPAIEDVLAMKREDLSEEMTQGVIAMLRGAFSSEESEETVQDMIKQFHQKGFNSEGALEFVEELREKMLEEVNALNIDNTRKVRILTSLVDALLQPFKTAALMTDGASLTIGWLKTQPEAVIPTYAHETDACADLYAVEDQKIGKHTCGTMVHTGLRANIPDGWFLEIRSRSGMAAKTPLRISNGVGTIDSGYKGEILVLFDNISGKDYEIHAGDRIAQIRPVPNYRFRSTEVKDIGTSERGEGGFGSSGK